MSLFLKKLIRSHSLDRRILADLLVIKIIKEVGVWVIPDDSTFCFGGLSSILSALLPRDQNYNYR